MRLFQHVVPIKASIAGLDGSAPLVLVLGLLIDTLWLDPMSDGTRQGWGGLSEKYPVQTVLLRPGRGERLSWRQRGDHHRGLLRATKTKTAPGNSVPAFKARSPGATEVLPERGIGLHDAFAPACMRYTVFVPGFCHTHPPERWHLYFMGAYIMRLGRPENGNPDQHPRGTSRPLP